MFLTHTVQMKPKYISIYLVFVKKFLTHTVQMKLFLKFPLNTKMIKVLNPHGSDETRNHYS